MWAHTTTWISTAAVGAAPTIPALESLRGMATTPAGTRTMAQRMGEVENLRLEEAADPVVVAAEELVQDKAVPWWEISEECPITNLDGPWDSHQDWEVSVLEELLVVWTQWTHLFILTWDMLECPSNNWHRHSKTTLTFAVGAAMGYLERIHRQRHRQSARRNCCSISWLLVVNDKPWEERLGIKWTLPVLEEVALKRRGQMIGCDYASSKNSWGHLVELMDRTNSMVAMAVGALVQEWV
jgi:hypothetical protein